MIRIDEVYQNVFLPRALESPGVGLHWFDPFGSTELQHICNLPPVDWVAKKRLIFWDQEPLCRERTSYFLERFQEIYRAEHTIIVTSEKNSKFAQDLCQLFGIDHQYYFFHAWAALDWYRGYDRSFLQTPFELRSINHTFLCMNNIIGGRRQHRLELLAVLNHRGLIKNNLVSFPSICPHEKISVKELCNKYQIDLGYLDLPLILDNHTNNHDQSCRITVWDLANRSFLQVVTETLYHGQRLHLTEKSFKPIVMQQPFLLVSCRGSLEYLRSYGFQTFGDFWDESYDFADDKSRIQKVGKLLEDLDNLSMREIKNLQKHIAKTVEHNYRWFYSREFEELLWKEINIVVDKI